MSDGDALVVDASVGVKLLLDEEGSAEARRILGQSPGPRLHVPDTFFAECGHVFRCAVLRFGLPPRVAERATADLALLDWTSWPVREMAGEAVCLANARGLSVHDACYVVLSDRTGAPLLTADRKLHGRLAGTRHRLLPLGAWHRVE